MLDIGIRFRHLQCFLTIAQFRSVGRAAEALAITQPALSKTLRELEEVLDVRLFDRGAKGMSLTNFGRLFLQHAAASVTSLRHGINNVKAARSGGAAELSIGVLPNAAPQIAPLAVRHFRDKFPAATVHVVTGTNARLLDLLRLGELDLVIGRLAQPEQMLEVTFEHLYAERLSVIVRRGHPLASVKSLRPSMFRMYPWVLPTEDTIIGQEIRRYLIDHDVASPTSVVETTSAEFGRGYVRETDTLWFVPRGAAELDIKDGTLVELPVNAAGLAGPVGVTTRTGAEMTPAAAAMIQSIRAIARSRIIAADNRIAMGGSRKIIRRRGRRSGRQST